METWMERLLAWYRDHARALPWRQTKDAYRIWVSEIMLQQTRVEAVRGYYTRFLEALPDVRALADVDEQRLLKLWEGLGYYSRARNLHLAAQRVVAVFDGRLPEDYDALLSLPGVGEYTAGAIASIAYGIAVPAVDGNVLRVMARLRNDPSDILDAAVKRRVRETLLSSMPKDEPGAFNQALMELGATVCVPNGLPHCAACPIREHCLAHASGTAAALPVKRGKKARRIEEKTVFVLRSDHAIAGYQRPATGLLASLWQLPDAAGVLDADAMARQLDAWGARPLGEWRLYEQRHIFTHVEWRMHVCAVEVDLPVLPAGWIWMDEAVHALPTAYRVCLS